MEKVPYLCGGTFFLLLVEAKAKSRPQRESLSGTKDVVSQKNMLAGLIRQFDSGFTPPTQGRAFDSDQADYRSCQKEDGAYLPFKDTQLTDAYDAKVRTDFTAAFSSMEEYADHYLNAESKEKMSWLGQALLTLLNDDHLIPDDQLLFYCDGGITKEHLLSLDYIRIPSLLLALWHFIVTKRPDNKSGRKTFEAWNRQSGEKGDRWTFTSDIGKTYPRNVSFGFDVDDVQSDRPTEDNAENAQWENVDWSQAEQEEFTREKDGVKEVHQTIMQNFGSGPQIKEYNGNIVININ